MKVIELLDILFSNVKAQPYVPKDLVYVYTVSQYFADFLC